MSLYKHRKYEHVVEDRIAIEQLKGDSSGGHGGGCSGVVEDRIAIEQLKGSLDGRTYAIAKEVVEDRIAIEQLKEIDSFNTHKGAAMRL